jgi:hypothetical protein
VAGVYDGSTIRLYVNGVLVGSPTPAPGSIVASGNDLELGSDPSNPDRLFNGLIDEAALYSRALSDQEIQTIYNARGGSKVGILANGVELDSAGNVVQGNLIGTNVTGTAALGNSNHGVLIAGSNNTVGGRTAAARNVISHNVNNGVSVTSAGNLVQGNFIGTDANGTAALGNGGHGVYILLGGSNNTIGGTADGAGNAIAYNVGSGVVVETGINNGVRRNSIHDNGGIGIDLGNDGVTLNDSAGHTGPNNYQNFPVLSTTVSTGSTVTIHGTLNSTPRTSFTLEFFADTMCNPSGYGEGERYLDSRQVLTDDQGNTDFTFVLNVAIPPGQYITSTATDPNNNTSEFSACGVVVADGPVGSGGGGATPLLFPGPYPGPATERLPDGSTDRVSLVATDAIFQEAVLPAAERVSPVALLTPPTGFARSQRPQPDPMAYWDAAVLDQWVANLLMES